MMEWCNTTYFLYDFCSITASLNINNKHTTKNTNCAAAQWQISFNNHWLHVWHEQPQMLKSQCLYEMLLYWMSQWLYKTIICVQILTQHITFIFITQSKFFPGQDMFISAYAHLWAYLCVYLLYKMAVLGLNGNKSIILWFCRGAREDWRMH